MAIFHQKDNLFHEKGNFSNFGAIWFAPYSHEHEEPQFCQKNMVWYLFCREDMKKIPWKKVFYGFSLDTSDKYE